MERYRLTAWPRNQLGKQKVKKLRAQGFLPAVIYGKGIDPTPLQVRTDDFQQMLKSVGAHVLVDLNIEGSGPVTTVVKKIQRSSLSLELLNIDFHKVAVTDVITDRVPLELVGEPRGVAQGGVLTQPLAELEIRGVAERMPASISVDVSHLGLGEALHVRDLRLPEGIESTAPPEEVVAAVHPPKGAESVPVEPEAITQPDLVVEGEQGA